MVATPGRAVVVGAGILGASSAWALRRAGWDVVVVEAADVAHPAASSAGVTRLIRTTYGSQRGYAAMVVDAFDAWDLVWAALRQRLETRTGMLAVDVPGARWAAESADTLEALGLPCTRLAADDVRRRWPVLRIPDAATAVHTPQAGVIRAADTVAALGRWLALRGVEVRTHTPVQSVDVEAGTATTPDGVVSGDVVVVAAGPWTPRLVGTADVVRLTPSRQVVVDLAPPAWLAAAWARTPAFLVLPAYGVPPRDGLPLKVGDHAFSLQGDPDDDRRVTPQEVDVVLAMAGGVIAGLPDYDVVGARSCYYAVAPHERIQCRPIGRRGWVLAGGSGHAFKMGPVLGLGLAAALSGAAGADDVTRWAAGRTPTAPFVVA